MLYPIENFKAAILEAVKNNSVTIIVAETGAGKTTQVPNYLMVAGYDVICTQPRIIASTSVAARVCDEYAYTLGGMVQIFS
jgi:HrpA-like RNA helicase